MLPHEEIPRIGPDTRRRWLVCDVPADAATLSQAINAAAERGWTWEEAEALDDGDIHKPGAWRLYFSADLPSPRKKPHTPARPPAE